MADTANSPEKSMNPDPQSPGPVTSIPQSAQPDPQPSSSSLATPPPDSNPPNPNPSPSLVAPAPTFTFQQQPYAVPPSAPSFRSAVPSVPLPTPPQFSSIPNANFQPQNPTGVQPPGVGPGSMQPYAQPPNPSMRPYSPMPNGYLHMPQGMMAPPGIPRFPPVYRAPFLPRPVGLVGTIPALPRPPGPLVRAPIIPPVVRPAGIPSVTPTEKPQTTVYVGKIASTVENDFILSLLQLCGPVKSWKRAQDPTNGVLKGFGFCEFDSAEGVLRAIRLLSKFNVDGQDLMLNFNQATREYLDRYVEKKRANAKKSQASGDDTAENEEGNAAGSADKDGPPKSSSEEDPNKEDNTDTTANKENQDTSHFGLVTDEDREADREALEKLKGMIEERLQTNPLPPPPPAPPMATDGSGTPNLEAPTRSKKGDSDVDIAKNDTAEDRTEDEMTSESKPPSEHDNKRETITPDRSRRNDRRSRDRDRERDAKWEKERELERYEREREQERFKREREREYKLREDEHRFRNRLRDWEAREKEKEQLRKQEREREKEREQQRRWAVEDQEHDSDDDGGYSSKKRKHRSSTGVEERKRRRREREDDLADRLKEEQEIAEAKMRRAEEEREKKQKQEKEERLKLSAAPPATNGSDGAAVLTADKATAESKDMFADSDGDSEHENPTTERVLQNGTSDESVMGSVATPDMRQSSNTQTRKLGFGLLGSGKRTAVPSVFHEEEDEDAHKDKKMRPLVPIDYSTEELQAVQHSSLSGTKDASSNLAAAAEFAKRISGVNSKEDRSEAEKGRRRSHEKSGQRDRDRNDHETGRPRDERRKETGERDKDRERGSDKVKTPGNQKLLDAKQLIDTIPKTKDELFSYEINWAVYDKNELHERMRPWISKKIKDFLGEEETSLVDYIVSTTREHVKASDVLDRLSSILDEEAEMFVLKMWRMLIFEIKKVETGLAQRSKD